MVPLVVKEAITSMAVQAVVINIPHLAEVIVIKVKSIAAAAFFKISYFHHLIA